MDEVGIGKVVLFPLRDQSDSQAVLEAYRKYPDRVIPFRGSDGLNLDDPASLNSVHTGLETGLFRGLGEIVTGHGWYGMDIPADHPLILSLWDLGAEYDIPITVHMGTAPPGQDQTAIPLEWLQELEQALEHNRSTTFI